MSRRKQANPRPLIVYDEEPAVPAEVQYDRINENNVSGGEDDTNAQDSDVFDEFAPLVMDTPGLDDDNEPMRLDARPQSPFSIKSKIINNNNSIKDDDDGLQSASEEMTNEKLANDIANDSLAGSNHSGSVSSMSPGPLGPLDPSIAGDSASSSRSSSRRGSKNFDEDESEIDDDLDDLVDELIRNKILPVTGEDGEKFICPICNTSLVNLHDLTVHIRSHNNQVSGNQSNKCNICGKILSSQSSLDRHMLVHSGERPFKCKICNMSFTTNGNMHRHSRIHTKEETLNARGVKFQMRRGKSAWQQRINNYLNQSNSQVPSDNAKSSFPRSLPNVDTLNSISNHSPSMIGRLQDNIPLLPPGMKRQFGSPNVNSDWMSPVKRHRYSSDGDTTPVETSYEYQLLPSKEEEEMDEGKKEDQEVADKEAVLHCPVCPKTFLCKYGLETHLETHPNYASHCPTCNLTFKTPRNLRMHRLMVHTQTATREGDISKEEETNLQIGFHDLSFVDFSVSKFPLIAKHHCEKNVRSSSSAYLNFTCTQCSRAFPCETSMLLHAWTHMPGKTAQCPLCECDYTDTGELHTHMLKHMSDKAFSDMQPSLRKEGDLEELSPQSLNKQDFMAMFDLKGTEDGTDPKGTPALAKSPVKNAIKQESKINNDYFPKLGQVFSPGVSPISPMLNNLPVFRSGASPSLDEFHKMLQIATNMNMLPSMGANLLSSTAHSSPSKFPANVSPQVSVSPQTAATQNGPLSGSLSESPVSTPSTSDSSASFGLADLSEVKAMGNGQFPCKYCDTVFTNYRTLKGHIRTHLGLSPYKCNLCIYSSADKSTLIRHLRTHNGERPFQCLVCDFAFTTKANCERHVRKKHLLTDKDDIEKAITFNKLSTESLGNSDSFHSPDTVCKHCGVDFKFFRALKHHLRSHGSCRQKPYQCQLCMMGFCTKANCVSHIQKQHPEVSDNQIEQRIKVVEHALEDNESMGDSVSDDGMPLYSDESRNGTPFDMRSNSTTPQPPAAHSTPKPQGLPDSRHSSPSPSPLKMVIKTEPVDPSEEQPLDFSVKVNMGVKVKKEPVEAPLPSPTAVVTKTTEDIPMDLSVKKFSSPIPIAPKPLSATGITGMANFNASGLFQCQFCPMGFSSSTVMERHLRTHHSSAIVEAESPVTSKTVAINLLQPVTSDASLKIPVKAPVMISSFQYLPNKGIFHARPIRPRPKQNSTTIQSLHEKIKKNLKNDAKACSPSASGSDSDLASVPKMMDATNPLNFQAFFLAEQKEDGVKSPVVEKELIFKPSNLSTGVKISLEHCKAINRELDMLEKEGDVDEVALAQVREMALSVKEECTSTPASTATSSTPVPIQPRTISPADSQRSNDRESISTEAPEDRDENSADGTTDGMNSLDKNPPVKKKRNSYADSPHKLSCPYCPRAFPWVSSLTRHLLTHTGQKPFKCPRCPVTFSTKSNRERHLIRKHGVNMLDPMSRQTMDRPYKCPLCVFSSFSTQSNLLKHYKDRHNGINLPDNISDIEQMSPAALKAATLEMESHAAANPQAREMGGEDGMEDEEEDEDKEDMNSSLDMEEKQDMEAEELDVMNDSPPSLVSQPAEFEQGPLQIDLKEERPPTPEPKPETKEEKVVKDIIAEQKFLAEQRALLESRIQSEIRAQIEAQKKLESPVPSEVRSSVDHFDSKPFTGSAERQINPERDNYDVDKITECWKCKELFPSRKVLVRHLKEHNIDLPYKCYLCDASYDDRLECLVHQEKKHESDWSILKDKNKVDNTEQFAVHMDKVVENNCNKLDQGTLLEIPGQGPDETKMEVVSADYMQRKVYCSLCPKRFWSLQDLRRHMRSHTGERPFECDICQKRFTLKHSMMRHRKKHAAAPSGSFMGSDDDDSNPSDDKGLRAIKPAPSRNALYQLASPLNARLPLRDGMPLGNTAIVFNTSSLPLTAANLTLGAPVGIPNSLSSSSLNGDSVKKIQSSVSAVAKPVSSTPTPTIASMKKEVLDSSADILQNLLGVENADIDKMLDSVDSAAHYLGMSHS